MKGTELENKHPMELFGRLVLTDNLRQIGAKKISMLNDEFHHFLRPEYKLPKIEGDTIKIDYAIDYEFAIFHATDEDYEKLMECFSKKPVMSEVQKSFIVDKHGN